MHKLSAASSMAPSSSYNRKRIIGDSSLARVTTSLLPARTYWASSPTDYRNTRPAATATVTATDTATATDTTQKLTKRPPTTKLGTYRFVRLRPDPKRVQSSLNCGFTSII